MVFSDKVSGVIKRWQDREQCGYISSESFEGDIYVTREHISKHLSEKKKKKKKKNFHILMWAFSNLEIWGHGVSNLIFWRLEIGIRPFEDGTKCQTCNIAW